MPPLLVGVEIGTLYYSPTEAGLTLVCLYFSRSPETRIPSTDRGWPQRKWRCFPSFQALHGFVLSMCYSIDTTCEHACDQRQIPVDSGSFLHCHSTMETLDLTV